jgi:hypothetical protein
LKYVRSDPFLFPPSGMYRYSLSQVEREMCQRLQNSVIDWEI